MKPPVVRGLVLQASSRCPIGLSPAIFKSRKTAAMPAVLEPPPSTRPSVGRGRAPFRRRLLVSAIRFTVVMLAAAVLGGAWYLAHKGFGREWRQLVVEELHKHGVEASVAHLTLDPFRGLVAKDVRIFDYKNRENT